MPRSHGQFPALWLIPALGLACWELRRGGTRGWGVCDELTGPYPQPPAGTLIGLYWEAGRGLVVGVGGSLRSGLSLGMLKATWGGQMLQNGTWLQVQENWARLLVLSIS